MACFLTPMFIAILTTLIQKTLTKKVERLKMTILNTLLWGGSTLLAVEHVWHGEVVPWPPFLTAMANPADVPIMFHEMMFTGGLMTATVFTVWGLILAISRMAYLGLQKLDKKAYGFNRGMNCRKELSMSSVINFLSELLECGLDVQKPE